MTNINPINLGISGNMYFKGETNEEITAKKEDLKSGENSKKQYNLEEVLNMLAAQNKDLVPVTTPKTLDVSKYVTEEQEARIADFMRNFEADFDEAESAALNEFPDISENAAKNIALAYINATY